MFQIVKRRVPLPAIEYEQRTLKFTLTKSRRKDGSSSFIISFCNCHRVLLQTLALYLAVNFISKILRIQSWPKRSRD